MNFFFTKCTQLKKSGLNCFARIRRKKTDWNKKLKFWTLNCSSGQFCPLLEPNYSNWCTKINIQQLLKSECHYIFVIALVYPMDCLFFGTPPNPHVCPNFCPSFRLKGVQSESWCTSNFSAGTASPWHGGICCRIFM